MFLKLLGSAAREGWPAVFCACEPCQEARRRGGKNLRRRTSYQLGDTIHIDFGPDSFCSMLAFGLDYSKLRHLFISHSHHDHWFSEDLRLRREGYGYNPAQMTVYGSDRIGEGLAALGEDYAAMRLQFHEAVPYEWLQLDDEVSVAAIPASHADGESALNYVFNCAGRVAVIGNDTGWWVPEAWDFLQTLKLHLVTMDCTAGPKGTGPRDTDTSWVGTHHLNCEWVVEVRDELARRGALAEDHTFIANHFSHNGGWMHEEFEDFFTPRKILVGFDGMDVEV